MWWREAVIYQVYPRSFADSDGDGLGDLPGITARLDHLVELGVDALWLSPFYPSPQADAGYDVADYRDVDPIFGRLADADELISQAHRRGLKVIVDLVPNHTSDAHPWFAEALAAPAGSPQRGRYVFRDGTGPRGASPPNNWESVFGGPAWTRVPDGQWYLHLFDVRQPDLNWDHPAVRAEFSDILRFWLARGVDGFRVDVAHGLVKQSDLPDWHPLGIGTEQPPAAVPRPPMWDQDGVHDIYRGWRQVLDGFGPQRILVAEAWVEPADRLAAYVRPDEMHQAFNFEYLQAGWSAAAQREVITRSLAATDQVGAPTTWVLSNHDVIRHATRLAAPAGVALHGGIGAGDPQPDARLGLRRARAATLLMLALPGSAYLYQGEELGLPEHTTLPDAARQDPTFRRSGGRVRGRDGCRVPLPWTAAAPAYGFGPGERSWLPQPATWARYALDQQRGVAGSTYEMYRTALRLRRELGLARGPLTWLTPAPAATRPAGQVSGPMAAGQASGPVAGAGADEVLALRSADTVVVTNFGAPVPLASVLPAGARVLHASAEVTGEVLDTDVTVWAR